MTQITDTMFQAVQDDAGRLRLSAVIDDGADFRTSAFQTDGANLNVSAKSNDAGTLRVSAMQFPNTTGGLTIFRNLNLSSSVNVKATAGAIYGWTLHNHDNVPQYVKFYNVSGAINVGTDTPIMTVYAPLSSVQNMYNPMGLVGFTAGISIAATSGHPDDNTAPSPASASSRRRRRCSS